MGEKILFLPGNLRYQPKQLMKQFGYDNLVAGVARVEIATLETLGEIGVIPAEDMQDLTPEVAQRLIEIPTTKVDEIERAITKHDVRAWVRLAQEVVGPRLARWIHVPLTSYDPLDTGRMLGFREAYDEALKPALDELVHDFTFTAERFADELQIGRTHGQHALPITVGFWLATILNRIVYNWHQMTYFAWGLTGKISGAVGAYNAQVGLNLDQLCREKTGRTFEHRVLERLGLDPSPISTQILPPEPLAYFLFSATMMSATLAQFGRDCRHLMRSEIGEVAEEFEEGQVGSSTMAQKRNPVNFEGSEGMFIRTKNEFGKVLDTLISEHQRDLVGSSVARDFPIILVNLMTQLNTLLRKSRGGTSFIRRITVNHGACQRNFAQSEHLVLAEPVYIALQMAGYPGDAHELVNRQLVPWATTEKRMLVEVLEDLAAKDSDLLEIFLRIPEEVRRLFRHPENYVGKAVEKTREIVLAAREESRRILNPDGAEG